MFREINGKLYNLMYAQSMNKVDEDDKYKIKYVIQNGRVLEEVFDSAEDRDADFEDALEASMGGGASKKVIGDLEDLETTAKDNLVNAINEVYDEVMDHSLYRYIGTVHSYSNLPSSGMRIGYVYNIETADAQHGISAGDNVAWTGTEWDVLSGTVDLSNYYTKDQVDEKCVPYQPFPSGINTSGTTQQMITSIKSLNLHSGSTYLGGVTLTDMPFNGNAEVEIYIYPGNVVYLVLRSANVSPYEWECNSHTYRGWEPVGKAYADATKQNIIDSSHKLSSDLVDDTNASNKFITSQQIEKLDGIDEGAQVNVQSDWEQDDTEADDYIKNKPTNVSDFTNDAGYLTETDKTELQGNIDAINDKFFIGSISEWSSLTEIQKQSYMVAIVEPPIVLEPGDISLINAIAGSEGDIESDMTETEAFNYTKLIIGGNE